MLRCLAEITWRPGIGDPNPLAWIITLSYFAACSICLWAAFAERALRRRGLVGLTPGFSFVIAALMFLLGWNKQLDLQTLLTQIGREAAHSEGWYEHRRPIQAAFVAAVGILGAGCVLGGLYSMRSQWKQYGLMYVGIVYLLAFVVIRAASFHHVDTILYRLPAAGYWVNTGLELGGTTLVGIGALLNTRRARKSALLR